MNLAVLQARSSSTRFPRKVLADLHGAPMIVRQLERVRRCELVDALVIATSTDSSDDELADMLTAAGHEVARGPLDDVVGRFHEVVRSRLPDHIIRLTADCPLADPQVIDRALAAHLGSGDDYTSNTLTPTYPDGLDVEVFSAGAFGRLLALPLSDREREHVTMGMYTRPDVFRLGSVEQTPDRSALRWTVDVPDDLTFVRAVYAALYDGKPEFGQDDVLRLLEEQPWLRRTDEDLARNAGSESTQEDPP